MLVSFKISNFLSFNKMQSFSMVPSLDNELSEHIIKLGSVKLLKMGIILGANSSGKSNLLKAIAIGRELINGTSPLKYRNFFCKIESENKNRETLFEFTFYINKKFYTYGYTLNLYSGKFLTEYLYDHDLQTDREVILFERSTTENNLEPLFVHHLDLSINKRKSFNKYLKDFSNSSDTLLITKINHANDIDISDFKNVYEFFKEKINPNFQTQDLKISNLDLIKQKNDVIELLKAFDTGINDLEFEEVDLNLIEKIHPDEIGSLIEYIEKNKQKDSFSNSIKINDSLYQVSYSDGILKIFKVMLIHMFAELAFEFFEESDGVKRLFDLFSVILAPTKDTVYLFDELNRCIHPLLIIKFIETFNKKLSKYPIQLIFTTHEANILKEGLIRRDEVWFVEKEKNNSSKIYSLDIFKLTNKKIVDSYLAGNFGAVPILPKD
ncbi:MAG TPA: ATP-binding protein [Acholeplasmataceae bacterium]|nr:ATP-binding protein [Acholeplasmataceae bacterium]